MVCATAAAALVCSVAKPRNWDDDAARRKAQYIYMESVNAQGTDRFDDYALLIGRAAQLDSTDYDINARWAYAALADQRNDSAVMERAYGYLKDRFYSDTTDYISGWMAGNIAMRNMRLDDAMRIWKTMDNAFPQMSQPSQDLARTYILSSYMGDSTAYGKALAIYDRMEEGTGKNLQLSSQKIRAYSIHNDSAAIRREVEELVAAAPKDSYVALFAGDNYRYLGDNDLAMKYYEISGRLDPSNGNAFIAQAQLYKEIGDSAAYDREVFRALKSENLEVEDKLGILHDYVATLYTDRSQESRIRELHAELERLHPGEPEIHNLFAAYLYEIGDYKGSAEELSYSVALQPANESAWTSWVQMLSLSGDSIQAIDQSHAGMARFPDNLYFPIVAAQSYASMGEFPRALAVLDSVKISEKVKPAVESDFITVKGNILSEMGDTLQALQVFDQAIALNPENFLALNNAAYFMAENNIDLDKAEQYIAKVLQNVNDNATYLDTYAWVCFKKADYSLAKQYIDMTINLCNDSAAEDDADKDLSNELSADVYEHAGDIYFFNQLFDQAKEFWKKAHALDPDNDRIARKAKQGTYFNK